MKNREKANQLVINTRIKEAGYRSYIPRYKVFHKGVIRGVPLDLTDEEIKTVLVESNWNIKFEDAVRLKRRRTKLDKNKSKEVDKGKPAWEPSRTVCVAIRGTDLPVYVLLWRARLVTEIRPSHKTML